MKIGIITVTNDRYNYGNILQNYALQLVIQEMGYTVETIDRITFNSLNNFTNWAKFLVKMSAKLLLGKGNDYPYIKRKKAFDIFRSKYIKYSEFKAYNNYFPKEKTDDYYKFVFGSDQIWNLRFRPIKEDIDIFFGKFAIKEKKISYAASFGTNDIPNEYRDYVVEAIKEFEVLSVREDVGKQICSELGRDDCVVVPDPTLLLTPEEWSNIEKEPKVIQTENYLLTYFLGKISPELDSQISIYAKKNNLEIVNLNNNLSFCRSGQDISFFSIAPDEFLWLIHSSRAVVTDSFHGTVFSLIYAKPFQVFERNGYRAEKSMNSRMETLLGRFDEFNRFGKETLDESLLLRSPKREKTETCHKLLREVGWFFLQNNLLVGVSDENSNSQGYIL